MLDVQAVSLFSEVEPSVMRIQPVEESTDGTLIFRLMFVSAGVSG